ncbi:YiiD C-terminal domain-containing protein [Leucothrix arctica]|uniref:YiiD C-terminal domain-containing protein n=1 Tax=Leucothrix arctica TaxID=1481894 RepID=UPI001304FA08|nr:YiiD C-terminal domain-containing protein [Leucothrix arctica]
MANNSCLDAESLTQLIHESIPLSEAMHFNIEVLADQSITVVAPLTPNINVHGTGFAGSLYSLAALSAWALTTHLINQAGLKADVVMASAEIRYRRPIQSEIRCQCECMPVVSLTFIKHLKRKGRARLSLMVELGDNADVVFSAAMVASHKA